MKKIYFLILFIFIAVTAEAKSLYVNNSGSPSCSDSVTYENNNASNPWCSLLRATWGRSDLNRNGAANASQAAQAGDTVYVTTGTYDYSGPSYSHNWGDPPLYQPANSGNSGAWITFQTDGGVVELTGNLGGSANMIGTGGTSGIEYIKFDGFTIQEANFGFPSGMSAVKIMTSNIKVENFVIVGTYAAYRDNHMGILAHGNRMGDCQSGLSGVEIRNNTISGFRGEGSNHTAITLYCLDNFIIENNTLHDSGKGVYGKSSWTNGNGQSIIRNNLIYNTNQGLNIQAWENIDIYQNVIRDSQTAIDYDAAPYYSTNTGPNNMNVVNNTFDNNTYQFFTNGVCSQMYSNTFKNNIVTNSTNALAAAADCFAAADIVLDHNRYEHSGEFWYNNVAATLSSFQRNWSQDANSTDNVNCLYTNEAGNDFTLQAGSSCREGQANDCVDVLNLDHDSSTVDAITCGAYITGNEIIGATDSGSSPSPVARPMPASNVQVTNINYN